jgi:hypothetical protein
MNKMMALVLLLTIPSLHGVQETKPTHSYARQLVVLLALTAAFKKVMPQKYCDQVIEGMKALGPVLAINIMFPFLIRDANHDQPA